MMYVYSGIAFYLFMIGVTVWIGGRIGYQNDGEYVAGFCWLWPITLIVVLFIWLFRVADTPRQKTTRKWERPHR